MFDMFRATILLAAATLAAAAPGPDVSAGAPQIFAPGVISGPANDGSPTFSPDGKTLLFTRSGTGAGTIMESHLEHGMWSEPTVASFSGEWNDQHPAFAPDGSYLVFVSMRPFDASGKRPAHLWMVKRTPNGWSAPQHLPAAVNIGNAIFAPSVASDGTIYFLSIGPKRAFQLYRSAHVQGDYQQAQPLPFSSPATADVDPEIAPNQSFLVFASSGRRGESDTKEHLYIVHRGADGWGDVSALRYAGDDENGGSNDNEPRIARDGRTIYFSSDRSLKLAFPRTQEQARNDSARINAWDNGNANVWTLQIP